MIDRVIHRVVKFSFPTGWLLYICGVVGFLLLSQPEFNYETYMSENALLTGLVDETYNPNRNIAYLFNDLNNASVNKLNCAAIIRREMMEAGLEVYDQTFTFSHKLLEAVGNVTSSNLYAIMRSRAGSRTEAILVISPLRATGESEVPIPGSYTYIISLAKQLKTQLYWAKDVIFLFPDMEHIGLLAWLDAYYGVKTSPLIHGAKLEGRSGSLQAGINIELPTLQITRLDIAFQGINGELPNLDIINAITRISKKLTIPLSLHGQLGGFSKSKPFSNLQRLLSSIWTQASGSPSGLHGLLINFQVPCITIRGIQSYMSNDFNLNFIRLMGSVIESLLRSLNNLQERFHQSFYYYLLPDLQHYISIGVYSPLFFTALSGLLVQVVRIYLDLSSASVKKPSVCEIKSDGYKPVAVCASDELSLKSGVENPIPSDTETQVTRRKKMEQPTKVEDTNKPPEVGLSNASKILSSVTSLALCLCGGALIHAFPDYLYAGVLAVSTDAPETVWPRCEIAFFCVFCTLFCGLAVVLPTLAASSKSHMLGYDQDWRLTLALSLLLWSVFLGCLSPLNISASFLLLVALEPVLLLLSHLQTRRQRYFGLPLLLLVSPPVLLTAATWLHPHIPQFPASPAVSTLGELLQQCGKVLLQCHMEFAVLGSWSWTLLTAITTPLWLFTWNGLILFPASA